MGYTNEQDRRDYQNNYYQLHKAKKPKMIIKKPNENSKFKILKHIKIIFPQSLEDVVSDKLISIFDYIKTNKISNNPEKYIEIISNENNYKIDTTEDVYKFILFLQKYFDEEF